MRSRMDAAPGDCEDMPAMQIGELERLVQKAEAAKGKKEMKRTWKYYTQWALYVLLAAVGIYCAYMA